MAGISLAELQKQLAQAVYTPLTDEQMMQQAQNKYASLYDQQRTAAQQAFDQTALALQQQRDQLAVNQGTKKIIFDLGSCRETNLDLLKAQLY